jgi:Leucine-rich repeat (LRR) protein
MKKILSYWVIFSLLHTPLCATKHTLNREETFQNKKYKIDIKNLVEKAAQESGNKDEFYKYFHTDGKKLLNSTPDKLTSDAILESLTQDTTGVFNEGYFQLKKIIEGLLEKNPSVEELQYSNDLKIKIIPKEVLKLEGLSLLALRDNEIKTIPPWIGDLKELALLDLHGNLITFLPPGILKLKKLKSLYLDCNKLDDKSGLETLEELKELNILSLENNNITSFPEWIMKLENLEIISLENNPINFERLDKKTLDFLATREQD